MHLADILRDEGVVSVSMQEESEKELQRRIPKVDVLDAYSINMNSGTPTDNVLLVHCSAAEKEAFKKVKANYAPLVHWHQRAFKEHATILSLLGQSAAPGMTQEQLVSIVQQTMSVCEATTLIARETLFKTVREAQKVALEAAGFTATTVDSIHKRCAFGAHRKQELFGEFDKMQEIGLGLGLGLGLGTGLGHARPPSAN
ncbi:uncharacterized protein EV422DRAFT_526290 [Fimicolochytrium jonesii]|uniref:uncharacterized protein n=1 Tax=Fimicolochytrium jonesii TaxID=1396493 RepID=UPI0022FE42B5|nr:uncharacterized protein EV422DRAFT_526290 [Fimicolochytrium jonesii]KAI8821614.1 hypothetical protein EV422DRAFT_526290 [Fimicolochytrium jonesii]